MPAPGSDNALRGIILTNAVTLALAVWQQWGVLQLLWPFWMQSLIIGWYARRRILALQAFSTEGLTINDRPVDPTPQTQRRVANFFVLHYGGFHLVYLLFLTTFSGAADAGGFVTVTNESTGVESLVQMGRVRAIDFVAFLALAAGFWHSHRSSHREHLEADLGNRPNLGTLMFLPYARVLPMHLTIILAAPLGGGAVWIFVLLKTGADVIMHKVEHRLLRGRQGVAPAGGGLRDAASID